MHQLRVQWADGVGCGDRGVGRHKLWNREEGTEAKDTALPIQFSAFYFFSSQDQAAFARSFRPREKFDLRWGSYSWSNRCSLKQQPLDAIRSGEMP